MTTSSRFLKAHHIRSGWDFRRAYARRCRASDGVLLVFGCENDAPHARLGLSVSRKVGNAVVRNRWKRVIREAFRLSRSQLPVGIDLVVIPKSDAKATLDVVAGSLNRLAQKIAARLSRDAKDKRR